MESEMSLDESKGKGVEETAEIPTVKVQPSTPLIPQTTLVKHALVCNVNSEEVESFDFALSFFDNDDFFGVADIKRAIGARIKSPTSKVFHPNDLVVWLVPAPELEQLEEGLLGACERRKAWRVEEFMHQYSRLDLKFEVDLKDPISAIENIGFVALVPEEDYAKFFYELPENFWDDDVWDEEDREVERAKTGILFDVAELKRTTAHIMGKKLCHSIALLASGAYGRSFLLTFEDGTEVVSRVDFAKYPTQKLKSEVATMHFIKKYTKIPIPEVYAFDDNPRNAIGAEYVVLEKIEGVSLETVWDDYTPLERSEILKQLVDFEKQMIEVSEKFLQHGSIYEEEDDPDKIGKFFVGPAIMQELCDHNLLNIRQIEQSKFGPWNTAEDSIWDFIVAFDTPGIHYRFDLTPRDFTALLETAVLLIKSSAFVRPTLLHPFLGQHNILVDPDEKTKILTVLDWEWTRLRPLCQIDFLPRILEMDAGNWETILKKSRYQDGTRCVPYLLEQLDKHKARFQYVKWLREEVPEVDAAWKDPKCWLIRRLLGRLSHLNILEAEHLKRDLIWLQVEWEKWEFGDENPVPKWYSEEEIKENEKRFGIPGLRDRALRGFFDDVPREVLLEAEKLQQGYTGMILRRRSTAGTELDVIGEVNYEE